MRQCRLLDAGADSGAVFWREACLDGCQTIEQRTGGRDRRLGRESFCVDWIECQLYQVGWAMRIRSRRFMGYLFGNSCVKPLPKVAGSVA